MGDFQCWYVVAQFENYARFNLGVILGMDETQVETVGRGMGRAGTTWDELGPPGQEYHNARALI